MIWSPTYHMKIRMSTWKLSPTYHWPLHTEPSDLGSRPHMAITPLCPPSHNPPSIPLMCRLQPTNPWTMTLGCHRSVPSDHMHLPSGGQPSKSLHASFRHTSLRETLPLYRRHPSHRKWLFIPDLLTPLPLIRKIALDSLLLRLQPPRVFENLLIFLDYP